MSTILKASKTLLDYFYDFEKRKANEVYLKQPVNGTWKTYTWAEVGRQARSMAAALKAMNLPEKSHIGLLSKNSAHWIMADLAIMMSGHVSVPFYATLTADSLSEVLTLSNTKVLFLGKLETWEQQKSGVSDDIHCITLPHLPGNSEITGYETWDDLVAKHEPISQEYYPKSEDLYTIIYTSGTTGTPKGVMLDYGAVSRLLDNERQSNMLQLFEGKEHRFFSYLPLNHIAERNIVEAASLATGGSVSFAESLDTFAQNLKDTQPTVFLAVPRIWTKFQLGILGKMPQSRLNILLKIPIINNVIRKKISEGLGLDKAKILITGAAPMPTHLLKWYQKLGMKVQEVYGMTENCAGCTLMPADGIKYGTVGKPMDNVTLKIAPDTGEVLAKAPWNMLGYYNAPEQSADILRDGWIHTGDQGEITSDGYLKLTGRVKDSFKTAKGKYVIPSPIEAKFAANNFIEQICVVGLGLPQPIALVNLSEIGLEASESQVVESLEELLAHVNPKLESYKKVKKIIIMKEMWSVENEILTPTLKIKRNVLDRKFLEQYDSWYNEKENVIWK
ncbi:MAG: long-chain acyl-CoA synthetase [Cognaticolwellia sp.]|jgi:long-subunit acyl-CoA synthetase (AMP-forming)